MSGKEKEAIHMDPQYIIRLTVTLFVTCVVVAACLGGVNAVTAEKIAAINWEKTVTAMKKVSPDATDFSDKLDITDAMAEAAKAAGGTLDSIYEAQSGGAKIGYAIKVVASGSQGNIEMMVGVDEENAVTGVSVVQASETSGIGTRVIENENGVLDQFQGKSAADGTLVVGTNVDAITGATVSTKGITAGVNAALAAANAIG